ncbi:MAG TPA: hypothetical protein VMW08_00680 [Acidimicrobiales bacterium]|nr:hypothetical protein [Acidimicrobiales bacterium]
MADDKPEQVAFQTNNPYSLVAPGARHAGQYNVSEDGTTIVASCSCRWHAEPVEIEHATSAADRTRVMVAAAEKARPLLDDHLKHQACPRCGGQGQTVDPKRPWIEPQPCTLCFGSRTCLPDPKP